MIVRSQNHHESIPVSRILRTKVEQKDHGNWLVTATVEPDRAIVLARYPNENEALTADTLMWLCEEDFYYFPVSVEKR